MTTNQDFLPLAMKKLLHRDKNPFSRLVSTRVELIIESNEIHQIETSVIGAITMKICLAAVATDIQAEMRKNFCIIAQMTALTKYQRKGSGKQSLKGKILLKTLSVSLNQQLKKSQRKNILMVVG